MAWLFDAATDKVLIPSGWSGGVGTVLMWVKRSASASNGHGNNPFRAWSNAAGGGSTLAGLDVQGSARTTLVSYDSAFSNITGGDIRSDGGSGAQAGWHPIALVMNGTAWALYYNTGTDPGALTKVTGTKAATGTVGSWTLSDAAPDWFDGAIACVKVFSRALSDAEVAAELGTYDQVSATNLVFRGTLKTSSTTPETGTAMTAGSTAVAVVDGPTRLLQPAVFAGSAPQATGALAAAVTDFGAVAGSAPRAVGTLAGSIPALGTFVGQTAHPAGALAGSVAHTGVLAGSAPRPVGALAATAKLLGALSGTAPSPFGDLFGGTDFGLLAGSAPRAVGRLRTLKRPLRAGGTAVLETGPVAASGPAAAELEAGPVAAGTAVAT
jgi:concanavalin A-like lectin/glucanase superfamily protein